MSEPTELNLAVARLLGLSITVKHVSPTGCYPKRIEDEAFKQMYRQSREIVYAGDKPLQPYHRDVRLAVAALEHVCVERELVATASYEDGRWIIGLWSEDHDIAGVDKSLALAICKALAELEQGVRK